MNQNAPNCPPPPIARSAVYARYLSRSTTFKAAEVAGMKIRLGTGITA